MSFRGHDQPRVNGSGVATSILSNWYIPLKLQLVPCYIPEVSIQ